MKIRRTNPYEALTSSTLREQIRYENPEELAGWNALPQNGAVARRSAQTSTVTPLFQWTMRRGITYNMTCLLAEIEKN